MLLRFAVNFFAIVERREPSYPMAQQQAEFFVRLRRVLRPVPDDVKPLRLLVRDQLDASDERVAV